MKFRTLGRATAVGMSLLLVTAGAVLAQDTLLADGDALTPVANGALNLGSVCPDGAITASADNVLLAIKANNRSAYPWFENSAEVSISATTVPASLTVVDPASDITVSDAWETTDTGNSSAVSARVSLNDAGSAEGEQSADVTFTATGAGVDKVGPNVVRQAISRTNSLTVNWTVLEATDPECASEPEDTTDPVVTISLSPASPDGNNGWYVSNVQTTVSATDASGIASIEYSLDGGTYQAYTGPFTVSADGTHTVDARATDSSANANIGYATQASFKIDKTDPGVTCNAASFELNQSPANVTANVTDETSLPLSATASAAADTSSVGSKSVSVTGYDNAGNSTTVSCPYSVAYHFAGFFRPVDNPTVLNTVKAGQAVPFKWLLTDANGAPVLDLASAKVTVATLSCPLGSTSDLVEEVASGSSGLQNLGDGYYQFNWKTPSTYAKSCKTATLTLSDDSTHDALFQFTK